MTCPPEIASILLRMMTMGFLAIRNCADDSVRCLALSDHLHNLPDLVCDFSPSQLTYYWEVERSCFIRNSVKKEWTIFESFWEELRPHVETREGGRRTGYLVVTEQTKDGAWQAFVPDLPWCSRRGESPWTIDIQEAILSHIESLRRHNEPVPPPSATGQFVMIDLP